MGASGSITAARFAGVAMLGEGGVSDQKEIVTEDKVGDPGASRATCSHLSSSFYAPGRCRAGVVSQGRVDREAVQPWYNVSDCHACMQRNGECAETLGQGR